MKKYCIKKSNNHGKGVFLCRNVEKDEITFKFLGKSVKNPPGPWRWGPNWLQVGYSEWIIPKSNSPGRYLNHSCNPNAGIKGKNTIIAMRPMQKGEEVLIDYALNEIHPIWHMICKCGSKNCRKVVKPYQDLSSQRKKRYEKYTSRYITDMKMHLSWQRYLSWKNKKY